METSYDRVHLKSQAAKRERADDEERFEGEEEVGLKVSFLR